MADREALLKRLLETFTVEASEHIGTLASSFLDLERVPPGADRATIVETAFREAHSLKGAARSVNRGDIETVCQALESVLSDMKRGKLPFSPALLDELLRGVRLLEQLQSAAGASVTSRAAIVQLVTALKRFSPAGPAAPGSPSTHAAPAAAPALPAAHARVSEPSAALAAGEVRSETSSAPSPEALAMAPALAARNREFVRVPTEKLDAVWLGAEALLSDKLAVAEIASELDGISASMAELRKRAERWRIEAQQARLVHSSVSAPQRTAQLPSSARRLEHLEGDRVILESLDQRLSTLAHATRQHQRSLSARTERLLGDARELLMLPASSVLDGLRHAVRDLSREQAKEVELVLSGEGLAVDRRVLAELKDPLLHVIRNCIDHGVELPAERLAAGKSAQATIQIALLADHSRRVEISISDDGRGVNVPAVKAAAVKHGLLAAFDAAELDDASALALVFESALSTSPKVSQLSGRGLGLAIVREKVEKLGGAVRIESRPGAGTRIRIAVPVALATFRGVLVKQADVAFVIPTTHLELVMRVQPDQLRSVENHPVVLVRGEGVALVYLAEVLDLEQQPEPSDARAIFVLVLNVGVARIALAVDEVCQEQEVLVKDLGSHLAGLPGVLGTTVLGNGKVVAILDTTELVRRIMRQSGLSASRVAVAPTREQQPARQRSVLVAEDSITSRALLKGILESAKFAVTTAVDGMDAFGKLRNGDFDLLVSDVDMPRLNGFGLTERVRADSKLAELPVVLVTSLDSVEDRERGVQVGANAYIIKRDFEQSNLLETIARLI